MIRETPNKDKETMTFKLSRELEQLATQEAHRLLAAGDTNGTITLNQGDPTRNHFILQTSRNNLTVLGSVTVDGTTFFLGTPSAA